ncbi:UDP-glucosyltransferase 2-like [Zerene cesonia]|uniref:UDP-glucosyltransferase 2-like n=1 Tax=Zerene cesonia TaxID=33412 RepID=UPI0018E4EC1B|nr:UDP-glucosyltransferase 2-like [Zerene cesonia]
MKVITVLLLTILVKVDAGRILVVVPTPSTSHQVVFQPLTRALVERGHDVVFITTEPLYKNNDGPPNLTEIDVRDISYEVWRKKFMTNTAIGKKKYLLQSVELFIEQFAKTFEVQLQSDVVQRVIKGELGNFDLLILEASVRPALIFSHIFSAPVIHMSTFGAMLNSNDIVGAPSHPLLYPWNIHQRLYNLTILEKVQELAKHWLIYNMYRAYENIEEEMLKNIVGSNIPSLQELSTNVHMLFYNSDPIWSQNQPVPPNVAYIGGINKKPEKELPKDLKLYLDSSKNGVIYISFGNNVKPSLLPKEKLQIFKNIFSELPYNILWRWDTDIPDRPVNVKVMRWVPQTDVLRHPNVKLFITQGGLQSTEEAIGAGVPLVGIPMIADQWYNTEKYDHFKIGEQLDIETLTEEEFRAAIKSVLGDKSYRDNVVKLRNLMRDQPQSGLERAVWWTEYVLRHGGAKHLRSPAANMPWTEYYEMELVSTILFTISVIITTVVHVETQFAFSYNARA